MKIIVELDRTQHLAFLYDGPLVEAVEKAIKSERNPAELIASAAHTGLGVWETQNPQRTMKRNKNFLECVLRVKCGINTCQLDHVENDIIELERMLGPGRVSKLRALYEQVRTAKFAVAAQERR